MHLDHDAGTASATLPHLVQSSTAISQQQSNDGLSPAEQLGIEYVASFPFASDARVAGYLIKADIGPTSYGHLFGFDLPPDRNFVKFEAIGVDTRGGYEIVRSAAGVAFVIVTYAAHARDRGLSHLREHIGANPDYYAARSLALRTPWKHTQEMIDQLEAGWKRMLTKHAAQKRIDTLHRAQASISPL